MSTTLDKRGQDYLLGLLDTGRQYYLLEIAPHMFVWIFDGPARAH
jgi:hypothetical protein